MYHITHAEKITIRKALDAFLKDHGDTSVHDFADWLKTCPLPLGALAKSKYWEANDETHTYIAEISELQAGGQWSKGTHDTQVHVPGGFISLSEFTVELDASGEDIAGWRLLDTLTGIGYLIIND
jgi:hypothetical protein